MKRLIQESYDQIHAPLTLTNETKQRIHEQMKEDNQYRKRKIKRTIEVMVATAACLLMVVFVVPQILTSTKEPDSIGNPSVNLGGTTDNEQIVFQSAKTTQEWQQLLKEASEKNQQTVQIADEYVVYEAPVYKNQIKYELRLQIQQGVLNRVQDYYELTGKIRCFVYEETSLAGSNSIDITNSVQFTKDTIQVKVTDGNQDGVSEIGIISKDNQGKEITDWYTIDSEFHLIK